jgi:NAD(P)-dependent dehydrogenase (short-subunit alcohol dehydrogenase family)
MAVDLGLQGKRALVTGAAVGIGRGIARWVAAAGCDVLSADRDGAMLEDAAAEVAGAGTRVLAATTDLRDPDAVRALVARVVADLGGLDVAVNNVGSLAGRMPAAFVDLDDDALRDVVEQNLFVTMWSCHAEAKAMLAAETKGVIVNVTSGETTRPSLRMAHYGAAKAAINHLTETLAV